MTSSPEVLSSRRLHAESRLANLKSRISSIDSLQELPDLCIYVTGSYGRLEASEHSDLDLFFIHRGSSKTCQVPRIQKTLVDAELIRLARELLFPEFSRDGEYLVVHYIDDIRNALGSPSDDYKNFFTARLLLLLESRPVHNETLYAQLLEAVVSSYYRDYHDHEATFRPIFLINDIIRFWRTLCLNYEHQRNRPPENDREKNKNHLMNLKLKFSRLLTCHSAIALLSRNREVVAPANLVNIIRLSPLERLDRMAEMVPSVGALVGDIKEAYSWFLHETGRSKEDLLEWIAGRDNRDRAFARGREFAGQMYELLTQMTAGTDTLRFLVV